MKRLTCSAMVFMALVGGSQVVLADECADLARRFADERDSVRVGELDTLRTCVSDAMRAKATGAGKPAYSSATAGANPSINLRMAPRRDSPACVEGCPPIDPNQLPSTASGNN